MHVYPNHLAKCPWCELERQGVIYFVDLGTTITPTLTGFTIEKSWALIEQIQPPPAPQVPTVDSLSVKPKPLPSNVPGHGAIAFYRLLVVSLALVVMVVAPKLWFITMIGGFLGWTLAGGAGGEQRKAERQLRQAALDWARKEHDQLIEQFKQFGPEGFQAKKQEFAALRNEYQNLPRSEKEELDKLHATAQARQKHKFLDRCFIDSANIKDVGPARKAALRSFGIETAADVERSRVRQVKGFGDRLTATMMDWKASCERRFTFNPANAVTDVERNALRAKYAARKSAIEEQLSKGAGELQRFRQTSAVRITSLMPQVEWAVQKLAQAQSDLALL